MTKRRRGACTRSRNQAISENESESECSDHMTSDLPSSFKGRPKLQMFGGKEDWMNLYEDKTNLLEWSDRMKVSFLDEYLMDDALSWFAQNRSGKSWDEIVNLMKKRFGKPLSRPMRDFVNLKYERSKGFAEYFRDKQALAQKAWLTDEQNHIIPLMIGGLTSELQSYFVSYEPSDVNEFYNTGLRAECATGQSNKRKYPESNSNHSRTHRTENFRKGKRAPSPC